MFKMGQSRLVKGGNILQEDPRDQAQVVRLGGKCQNISLALRMLSEKTSLIVRRIFQNT